MIERALSPFKRQLRLCLCVGGNSAFLLEWVTSWVAVSSAWMLRNNQLGYFLRKYYSLSILAGWCSTAGMTFLGIFFFSHPHSKAPTVEWHLPCFGESEKPWMVKALLDRESQSDCCRHAEAETRRLWLLSLFAAKCSFTSWGDATVLVAFHVWLRNQRQSGFEIRELELSHSDPALHI